MEEKKNILTYEGLKKLEDKLSNIEKNTKSNKSRMG